MDPMHTIDIPADLVKVFEAALLRRRISVGVTFHDDGSRSYHVDPGDWDEPSIIRAAEESVDGLRTALGQRGKIQHAGN